MTVTDVYFARRSGLYGSDMDQWCVEMIFGMEMQGMVDGVNLIDPYILIKDRKKEIDNIKISSKRERFIMEEICFPAIDKSPIFVYYLDDDDIDLSPGVEIELDRSIKRGKQIFRIFKGSQGLILVQMKPFNVGGLINKWCKGNSAGDKIRNDWALKSVNDYLQFYDNNIEAVELIINQFKKGRWITKNDNDKEDERLFIKGDVACIPHYNSAHMTNDYSKVVWCNCPMHQGVGGSGSVKHAFYELRNKEFLRTCMYTGIRSVAPGYSKMKLDRFEEHGLENLLSRTRTIHRSMNVFENSVFDKGMVLRDITGDVIIGKGGKSVADLRKIMGCIPILDLDIDGSFFDDDIFRECQKAVEIIRGYMDKEWPGVLWRLGFSGNGLYVEMDRLIFKKGEEENDGFTYGQWLIHWKQKREILEKLLRSNRIWKVSVERKYGWNRYFKVMFTFHLSKDRLAIPLNKDKDLDYEYINYYSNIKNGLYKNISKEIIDKAGLSWSLQTSR